MAHRPDPDGNLKAISKLDTIADTIAYFTGETTAALTNFTSLARSLLAATTKAAMRIVLGVNRNYTLVDPEGGGDYTTVQAALDNAVAGDQIVVLGNTYTENLDFTGVPDGVRLNGQFNDQNVIIEPASDASPTVKITGSHTIREFTIKGAATGSQPAISVTSPSGKVAVIYSIVTQGQGGAGDLLHQTGEGICAILGGFYHNGGTTTGAVMRFSAGSSLVHEVIGNFGTAADLVKVDGGSVLLKVMTAQLGSSYTLTDLVDISSGTIGLMSHQGYEADPAYDNGLHISGDGVTVDFGNVHLHADINDILIDASLNGIGTDITFNAVDFKQETFKNNSGATWESGVIWSGFYVDTSIYNDPATRFLSDLSTGSPLRPKESAFGSGDSTVYGMLVYTDDGTGTSYTDVTSDLLENGDSNTATAQGLGSGQATILFGSLLTKFSDVKLNQTVIAVLGSGTYVAEVWTGSAWTAIGFMQSEAVDPYNSFGEAAFTKLTGRLHFDTKQSAYSSWTANDPVSYGTNAYWLRMRNVGAITTAWVLDRCKIGYNRCQIPETGVVQRLGDAVQERQFWTGTGEDLSAPSGGSNAPGNADITVSTNVSYRQARSTYTAGQNNRAGTQVTLPAGLDTSKPVTFSLAWTTDGTSTNNVIWNLYITEVTIGSVLNSTTVEQPVYAQSIAPDGVEDKVYRTTFTLDLGNLTPGDNINFMLWRQGTTDTNPDDAISIKMFLYGWFWG